MSIYSIKAHITLADVKLDVYIIIRSRPSQKEVP